MSERIPCRVEGCPRTFAVPFGEGSHQKAHRGEKPTCPYCRGTQRFRDLDGHIKKRHPGKLEPEVGEEVSWETADHWQEFEDVKAENIQLKADLAAAQAEIVRLEGLRKRYYDNWQKAKSSSS